MSINLSIKNNYGIIVFIFAGILIIPQLYYLSNIKDFSYDYFLLLSPFFLSLVVFLIALLLPRIKHRGQALLAGFGLSILLCDQFLKLDISQLDGSSTNIVINPLLAILNGLLYFGLPIGLLIFEKRLRKILIDLSYVFVFLGLALTIYTIVYTYAGHNKKEPTIPHDSFQKNTKQPNIYFIWLDAMETNYFKKHLSGNNSSATSFNGFRLFQNNSANYLYTRQSYVSFMSGTLFKGGNYQQWEKKSDNLRLALKNLGYHITTYAKKDFISKLDNRSLTSDEIYLNNTKLKHPYIADFISYWVVRSLPAYFGHESLEKGMALGNIVHSLVNSESRYLEVRTIADGIEPLTGVFTLNQFIQDEPLRNDNNEFVILHSVIPHGPYVIDKHCGYRGRSKKTPAGLYLQQVECASTLLNQLFSELKALNRYDSSIIVVMGDHGSGWADLIGNSNKNNRPLNKNYSPWSKSQILSRASALLMIKPPLISSDKTELVISEKESQLVDIFPSILSLIGKSDRHLGKIDGVDLFERQKALQRKIHYFFQAL